MPIKTRPAGLDFANKPRWDAPPTAPSEVTDGIRWYRDKQFALIPGFRPLEVDVAVPDGEAPCPLVVIVHGGGWEGGSPKLPANDNSELRNLYPRLLELGIAVALVQYRLSGEARFPAQLHDVQAAVRWIRHAASELGIDADHIAIMGESAGGHLALLVATNVDDEGLEGTLGPAGSSAVTACVAWYPVTDFSTLVDELPPDSPFDRNSPNAPESRLLGAVPTEFPAVAQAASPINYITPSAAPTLLIHGTADRIVPDAQSIRYHDALTNAGVRSELVLVDGAHHVFFDTDPEPLLARSAQFLAEQLGV